MMKHKGEYSVLALLAGLYLVFIYRYQATPYYLFYSTLVFASAYFVWGIWHHLRTSTFHARVVLEYFLVALMGLVIIATLLI